MRSSARLTSPRCSPVGDLGRASARRARCEGRTPSPETPVSAHRAERTERAVARAATVRHCHERYRGTATRWAAMATCFRHPDRETGRALHPLRAPRVSRLPHAGRRSGRSASSASAPAAPKRHRADPPDDRTRPAHRDEDASSASTSSRSSLICAARRDDRAATGSTAFDLGLYGPSCTTASGGGSSRTRSCTSGCCTSASTCSCSGSSARSFEPGTGPGRASRPSTSCRCSAGAAGALIATPHGAHRRRERRHLRRRGRGDARDAPPRHPLLGHRLRPLLVINLVLDFFEPNISIGGHIGGVIGGRARRRGDDAGPQGRDARARLRRRGARRRSCRSASRSPPPRADSRSR